MLRRVVIVAILAWAMYSAQEFAGLHAGDIDPLGMAGFGFIVLVAFTLAELAERLHLPHVTGYILAGLVIGPPVSGLVSSEIVHDLKLFDDLAKALIAMEAGAALDLGALRRTWKSVTVLTLALIVGSLVVGLGFAWSVSGAVPGLALPLLTDQPGTFVLATGLLLGILMLATSPPVTLAVMNETKAKGPFSSLLLSTVVINNIQVVILFAGAAAVVGSLTGVPIEGGLSIVALRFGESLALGLVVGGAAAAVLRFVPQEGLLALVGLCFVGTYVNQAFGGEPLLTFIMAGALLSNVGTLGPKFKAVAARLAGPVYVLFFALVGAGLHVDEVIKMFGFAITLVALRLGTYFAMVRVTDRVVALPDAMRRVGFLGLAPQAGIAIAVVENVRVGFSWGPEFATLGLAAIAMNEAMGPILLKWSLGLAGEARGSTPATSHAAPDTPAPTAEATLDDEPSLPGLSEWLPDPGRPHFDPWGGPPATGDARLDALCLDLASDLESMVRDLRTGVVSQRRESSQTFVHQLRREFLRGHRRATVKAEEPDLAPEVYVDFLRSQRGELAGRWKALLLDRAARADFRAEQEALDGLVRGLESLIELTPTAVPARLRSEHLAPAEDDGTLALIGKAGLRIGRRVGVLDAEGHGDRLVEPRAIARYYISGYFPLYLQDLVGLLMLTERHLLARARNLFESLDRSLNALEAAELAAVEPAATDEVTAEVSPDDAPGPLDREARLAALRHEVEDELQLAAREVDRLSDETVRVAERALGRCHRAFVGALRIAGTPSLPPRAYRFSRIYEQRHRAVTRVADALSTARDLTRGTAGALAMELELVRLGDHVRQAVEASAAEVSRDVRGRIGVQLERVGDALNETLGSLRQTLANPPDEPVELLKRLERATDRLGRVITEAVGIADQYRTSLKAQTPFAELFNALAREIDHLTDHFEVVFDGAGEAGDGYDRGGLQGRGLPPRPVVVMVAFRELARSYLEVEVSRSLSQLSEQLEEKVDIAFRSMEELDRVLTFNIELTRTELEVLTDTHIPDTTLEVLDQSLVGTLQRVAHRVSELQRESTDLAAATQTAVRAAVLGNLDQLRGALVAGRLGELRARQAQQTLAEGRREIRGAATRVAAFARQLVGLARTTVGEDTLEEARRVVGLPHGPNELGLHSFRVPLERVDIPVAYRRLFSDQALEAGDLLTGREAEVARLRRVLLGETPGTSRAAAVISVGGMGKEAVVQSLMRGLYDRTKVVRWDLTKPLDDPMELIAKVADARRAAEGAGRTVIVVEGFEWLFSIRPGGFDLLRAFVDGVVSTSDRLGWLVSADRPVWSYANRVVPLQDAFPERIYLDTLGVTELRRAVMSRHAMSGYKITFRRPTASLWWAVRERLSSDTQIRASYEDHYFRALHADSGGVLSDALRLWLASINSIDTARDVIAVGQIPHPPIRAIRRLPDDVLITLRQVARQGRLTAPNHALQFRVEPEVSSAYLARLSHWGLLYRDDLGAYRFQQDMAGPLYRVLHERRLVG